jgi:hypothetical protein
VPKNRKTFTTSAPSEIEITLETALMLAAPGTTTRKIAEGIYTNEPQLMADLHRSWMIDRLIWMLNRKRANVPLEDQLSLPGFPTFPRRLTLKNGGRPFFMQANLTQLKEFREVLLKRRPPRLRVVERLIELMTPYAKKRASISVVEVITAEKQKHGH